MAAAASSESASWVDPDIMQPESTRFYCNQIPDFSSYFYKNIYADVNLVVGKRVIKANRSRLASVSSFLASIFAADTSDVSTVILPEVDFTALNLLISFLYTGFMRVAKSELTTVLRVASLLGIEYPIDIEKTEVGVIRVKPPSKRKSPGKQLGEQHSADKRTRVEEPNVVIFEGPQSADSCCKVFEDVDNRDYQEKEVPETFTIADDSNMDVESVSVPTNSSQVLPEVTEATKPAIKRISPRPRIKKTKTRNDLLMESQNHSPISAIVISGDESNDASRSNIEVYSVISNVEVMDLEAMNADVAPVVEAESMVTVGMAEDCATHSLSELAAETESANNAENLDANLELISEMQIPEELPNKAGDEFFQEDDETEVALHVPGQEEIDIVESVFTVEPEVFAETRFDYEEDVQELFGEDQINQEEPQTEAVLEENLVTGEPDQVEEIWDSRTVDAIESESVVVEELCEGTGDQGDDLPVSDPLQDEVQTANVESNFIVEEILLEAEEAPLGPEEATVALEEAAAEFEDVAVEFEEAAMEPYEATVEPYEATVEPYDATVEPYEATVEPDEAILEPEEATEPVAEGENNKDSECEYS
ncbi:protein P200-like [Cloeon dipterum]|uniref:protein P200-like n=1 Tax=Cloeon dipterum TaxID=197152 RepID=UPI00321F6906